MSGSAGGRARRGLLVVAAVLLAIGALAAIEGVLSLAGVGEPPISKLRYQQVVLPSLAPAPRGDGTPGLHTVDPRIPRQVITAEKAADSLRVFVFGGSAAAGLGFSPNVTFARHLERMLRAACPDRAVEVLNLGVVALASRQVRALVEDACANGDPDLLVVYSGNNEFLEIHAEEYAWLHAGLAERARRVLTGTRMVRALRGIVGSSRRGPSRLTPDDRNRVSESTIVQDVELTDEDFGAVVDEYEENVAAMIAAARDAGVPLVLMTVASNWHWRGKDDLRAGWEEDLLPDEATRQADGQRVLAVLDDLIAAEVDDLERWEWMFRRAATLQALGDARAPDAYRAALDADPHLRRAVGPLNERVRRLAREHGTPLLDTEQLLAAAGGGTIGFEAFYDYVHFTPLGATQVAAALFDLLRERSLIEPADAFDPQRYVAETAADLAGRDVDYLDAHRWIGFCRDRDFLTDRDLWKYDRMLAALDEGIARDPTDVLSLVYRGNARSFQRDGVNGAEQDWRKALELDPTLDEVRENLRRLEAERRSRE